MKSETVLYIGRSIHRADSIADVLQKTYPLRTATSGKAALDVLAQSTVDLVILDAASLRTPGERICRRLLAAMPAQLPLIHILPPHATESALPGTVALKAPVTPRRLLNQIRRALDAADDPAGEVIACGPFSMNVPARLLTAYNGQEVQLNPKLASLVAYFLRHPNQTVERRTLMECVWHTDYLGDTRTLDVHIRWAREALEDYGRHPRHLKTVRGVGYRLEIHDDAPAPLNGRRTKR